jgi:hypothetical protein
MASKIAKSTPAINPVSFKSPVPTTTPMVPAITTPEEMLPTMIEEPFTDITGDIDGTDVSHTQLAVKHGIDQRFPTVSPGNFVSYLGAEEYYSLPGPLRVINLKLDKLFIQVTEQGEIPIRVKNAEEMAEAGGTLDLNNPELLHFRPAADILLLVAGLDPKKLDGVPFVDALGSVYAPMNFCAKSSAYESTAKVLISWSAIKHSRHTPAPMCDFPYDLVILRSPYKGTTFFKPSLRRLRDEPHSAAQIEAFVEIAKNL